MPQSNSEDFKLGHYLDFLHSLSQARQRRLCVAVEHARNRLEEEGILQSRKAFAITALEHHYRFRAVNFDDGHSRDGTLGIIASIGIDHVISANDYSDVGL